MLLGTKGGRSYYIMSMFCVFRAKYMHTVVCIFTIACMYGIADMRTFMCICYVCTAQGGSGSFKDRKPIGGVRCCESWMAEQTH